jgi:CxxC motif-containing protein
MTEIICITCPKGCHLKVDEENDYAVTGNSCPRGAEYGKNELKNPVRVVTSTVKTTSKDYPRCPVKTKGTVPKSKMFEVMSLINDVTLDVPIKSGDVIIKDILNTGIDLVACKDIDK